MEMHLVVVRSFDGHNRGDIITDAVRIAQILGSEHARCVVRVAQAKSGG